MATKTWNGTAGNYADGTQWSDGIVPASGDTAIINSGTVTATSIGFTGVTVQLNGNSGAAGSLVLNSDMFDAASVLTISDSNTFGSLPTPMLTIQGTTTNSGTINFLGTTPNVQFGSGAVLVNAGTLNLSGSSPQIQTGAGVLPGAITNNGLIQITNPSAAYQSVIVNATIGGTGTINIGSSGAVALRQSVSGGQTVSFTGGSSAGSALEIDAPNAFGATVSGFVTTDRLILTSIAYTNYTYTSTSASSGTLTLLSGSTVESQISLSGIYAASTFTVTPTALGSSGLNNVTITTSVTNAATGVTSDGTIPGAVGAVYRFFDNKLGTHFFTSDIGERNTVLATRSADLIQETNGFGDVGQTSTSAVAVFRFFDTTFGTHFFTANTGERDTILATRPDLTYEPNSTFYEHSSQQSGDTAVYRLFDTKTGTQFLTGDTNEYKGLTTAGASTYRADLRSEGVAFYAPTGTFT